MKTTDMFLSAEERKFGKDNIPIVLTISKKPQGQALSPHIISLREENFIFNNIININFSIIDKFNIRKIS